MLPKCPSVSSTFKLSQGIEPGNEDAPCPTYAYHLHKALPDGSNDSFITQFNKFTLASSRLSIHSIHHCIDLMLLPVYADDTILADNSTTTVVSDAIALLVGSASLAYMADKLDCKPIAMHFPNTLHFQLVKL